MLNDDWLKRWTIKRMRICLIEWTMYIAYIVFIGAPTDMSHWILFLTGLGIIAADYYYLAKLEYEVGLEPPHSYIIWLYERF